MAKGMSRVARSFRLARMSMWTFPTSELIEEMQSNTVPRGSIALSSVVLGTSAYEVQLASQ
jgi:hypothetical protein